MATLCLALLLPVLAGCSGLSRGSLDAARLAVFGSKLDITAEQVAANPYAQMLVQGDDFEALMVLGNDDAGRSAWYSPDRRIIFLQGGLLSGTAGLPQDASDIRLVGDNPFARLASLEGTVATLRRYDWMPGYRHGAMVQGELRRTGPEQVEILGTTHTLVRFDESLRGAGVEATNTYWAEPQTGFIRRSRQLVAPGHSVDLVQLKPYRPGGAR
ncbi:hypothetical protein WQ56_08070 [Luteimonas sp. FCS-9]|nr:hypothetical protein WQ56_08070 [Luteimonas sp. FCS-9]